MNNGPPVDEEGSGGCMYDICDDDDGDMCDGDISRESDI